jgi:hypothetical protein
VTITTQTKNLKKCLHLTHLKMEKRERERESGERLWDGGRGGGEEEEDGFCSSPLPDGIKFAAAMENEQTD